MKWNSWRDVPPDNSQLVVINEDNTYGIVYFKIQRVDEKNNRDLFICRSLLIAHAYHDYTKIRYWCLLPDYTKDTDEVD